MERNNNGVDGVEKQGRDGGVVSRSASKPGVSNVGWDELILRVLSLLLTLGAAILLGIDKQTKTVPLTISPDLPPFYVQVAAKYSHVSAFVYFVVANSIACVTGAISLALAFANKGGRKGVLVLTTVMVDLIMVALLFSCIGAAGAIGVVGLKGNTHLRWNKVCNVYGRFCHQTQAALALSFFAAVAYLLLVLLLVSKLYRRS